MTEKLSSFDQTLSNEQVFTEIVCAKERRIKPFFESSVYSMPLSSYPYGKEERKNSRRSDFRATLYIEQNFYFVQLYNNLGRSGSPALNDSCFCESSMQRLPYRSAADPARLSCPTMKRSRRTPEKPWTNTFWICGIFSVISSRRATHRCAVWTLNEIIHLWTSISISCPPSRSRISTAI